MKEPWTLSLLTAAAILLALTGWRWHEAVVAGPDRIPGVAAPTFLLLVGEGDCPDRRAAMAEWVRGVGSAEGPDPGLPIVVGMLRRRTAVVGTALEPELSHHPRLDPSATARAVRAVLRAELEGTPALLLLDEAGRVLLADAFTDRGPGPRFTQAAGLLAAVAPGAPRSHPHRR